MLLKGMEIKYATLSKNVNKSGTKLLTTANLDAISNNNFENILFLYFVYLCIV